MLRLIFYYWIKLGRFGKLNKVEGPFGEMARLFVKTQTLWSILCDGKP